MMDQPAIVLVIGAVGTFISGILANEAVKRYPRDANLLAWRAEIYASYNLDALAIHDLKAAIAAASGPSGDERLQRKLRERLQWVEARRARTESEA